MSRVAGLPGPVAVHVDHNLHPDSAAWADQAEVFANDLGVQFLRMCRTISEQGEGLEAAARAVRYQAFESLLEPGDWLLSAQHADDQAETFLLHLLRGSGPLGLSAMPTVRDCGAGKLLRPLLQEPRRAIEDYARQHGLAWTEDPSNLSLRFDRNYARHRVMPRLLERWPAATQKLGRSAALAAEAQDLLDGLAATDLEASGEPGRLRLSALASLAPARQRNLLRYAVRQLGLPSIPAAQLDEILLSVVPAREDAAPLVRWGEAEARRYRHCLYLHAAIGDLSVVGQRLRPGESVALGPGLGVISLERSDDAGIDPKLVDRGLQLAVRVGGERLRPATDASTRALKTLFQEAGILPWMRHRVPLLKAGDDVVAVADLWLNSTFVRQPGYRVRWMNRPALD